jgi:hypothetical protein
MYAGNRRGSGMKDTKTPELDMVMDCYTFFKNVIDFEHVVLEVPFLSRCIDMVLINRNGVIFTIEFKVGNIRQAIKQVRDHSLGADYAFICMPEKKKIDMELLKSENIGLFSYNPSITNIVRTAYYPNINKNRVPLFNEMLLKYTMMILAAKEKVV